MHKIYADRTEEEEYKDGLNFVNGERSCPKCKSPMERKPLNQPYIDVEGGKILVDASHTTGKIHFSPSEPDYLWVCQNEMCRKAITTAKYHTV